jgi:hypothetical protein
MNLYFKDVNSTGSWNDPDHWFEDAAATIAHNAVPWITDDATKGYDLYRSTDSVTNGETVNIDATIGSGFVITGECFIGFDSGSNVSGSLQISTGSVYGGTFRADFFDNYNSIYGGIFSGDAFTNRDTGKVYGAATFSGDGFINEGEIYSGTYSGENFTNNSYIDGGVFIGGGFNNTSGINGGIFSGDAFTLTSGGINGGVFTGTNFNNVNGSIYGGIFSGDAFSSSPNIDSGFWLESGSMDVAVFDYSSGGTPPTVSEYIRITGNYSNPRPYDLSSGGFMTLRIAGQDVLGTGLL